MFTKRIHVFKAGSQTSAQGVERKFTPTELQQVVDTYDPSIHEAPLVLGHMGDNDSLPSYGWIQRFERQGENLYAEVAFTDVAKDLVKDGHYRKVSISFYSPESQINPHKGKWSARHLALLGASPPAVKGLEPFSFKEGEGLFDFALTLDPDQIFDEELGPTMIVEKSPLEMLKEKLEEVRKDVSSAVQELQQSSDEQTESQAETTDQSSAPSEIASPDNNSQQQFAEAEITQQTAELEDNFPEERFMENGKISRKHTKGANGQVMQVVENVYEEADEKDLDEQHRELPPALKKRAQEVKEQGHFAEDDDEHLDAKHRELPPALKKRAQEVKEQGHFAEDDDEMDYDEFGRDETARSNTDSYATRQDVGKESGDNTGRFKTAKNGEQDKERGRTASNGAQDKDRLKTAKASKSDSLGESRWAGQKDGYDQTMNNDEYDDGQSDLPSPNRPKTSKGTDPAGRGEGPTRMPVETEESPDDEVFAVGVKSVMSDKDMRVLRQTSSQGRQAVKGGKIAEFGESDEEDLDEAHSEGAGKPSKEKQLTPGAFDDPNVPAENVGPSGAYSERAEKKSSDKHLTPGAFGDTEEPAEEVGPKGAGFAEKKASKKQLTPGAMDKTDEPAETVEKSGGAFGEEHGERKNPYSKTGFGSTYDEGEDADEDADDFNELSEDHCGMGSMGQARPKNAADAMFKELEELKTKYAELERRHSEEKKMARKEKIAGAVGHLYAEGRLTDGIMPEQELVRFCEGLEFGTLEFSEGETPATKLLTLLSNLPPMVSFSEYAGGTFQYAEEDLDPHTKALRLVESEGIDYVEAIKRTMFS